MPDLTWDVERAVYLVGDGEVLEREILETMARSLATAAERTMENLVDALLDGDITPAEFEAAAQRTLKNVYNTELALGAGGWAQTGFEDWGRNGGLLGREYRRLSTFLEQIPDMTRPQARARARLYARRAEARFWSRDRAYRVKHAKWETWITGSPDPCQDCSHLAAMGRVPAGTFQTVPRAGDTACLGNCLCRILYEE